MKSRDDLFFNQILTFEFVTWAQHRGRYEETRRIGTGLCGQEAGVIAPTFWMFTRHTFLLDSPVDARPRGSKVLSEIPRE